MTSSVAAVTVSPELAKRLRTAAGKLDEWQTERDALIVQAIDEGASLREVAALVGLTAPGIMKIRDRASG